ncbi:hypothetical protein PtB15_14B42 [Puccinia triticina]|nr:hypothetical protein PtB15_5B649 [Puccinia triticina]WAR58416.1 hypothetical protein PtB15_5B650 [Puccinia triticina]WAR61950.1 hypothetical protein PtB15_14B42 [Puccinia triticina]
MPVIGKDMAEFARLFLLRTDDLLARSPTPRHNDTPTAYEPNKSTDGHLVIESATARGDLYTSSPAGV